MKEIDPKRNNGLRQALLKQFEEASRHPIPLDMNQKVMLSIKGTKPHSTFRSSSIYKVAASLIVLGILSGIAYATWHGSQIRQDDTPANTVLPSSTHTVATADHIVRFDHIALDSILSVVAAHYQKEVIFKKEDARKMYFMIEWDKNEPLGQFIELINNFDGVNLHEENEKIIVE